MCEVSIENQLNVILNYAYSESIHIERVEIDKQGFVYAFFAGCMYFTYWTVQNL